MLPIRDNRRPNTGCSANCNGCWMAVFRNSDVVWKLDLHLAGIISFVVNNTQLEFRSDFEIGNLTAIVVTFQLSYGRTKSEDRGSRDTFCNHIRERARGGGCR